jgi:hypothetical protein
VSLGTPFYEVARLDAPTFAEAWIALLLTALAACWLPASQSFAD